MYSRQNVQRTPRDEATNEVTLHLVVSGDCLVRVVDELSNVARVVSAASVATSAVASECTSICVRVQRSSIAVILRYVSACFAVHAAQYVDSDGTTAVVSKRRTVEPQRARERSFSETTTSVSV